MAVSLVIKNAYYELGSSSLLNAFFSSIYFHLVMGKKFNRYPKIFPGFFQGKLDWRDANEVRDNFKNIREGLKQIGSDKLIWDIYDLTKAPPWDKNTINETIPLSDFFTTEKGVNFFDIIDDVLEESTQSKTDITIR